MNLLPFAFLIPLAFFVLLTWFRLDMRSILRAGQVKNQLSIQGQWKALERYFQRASKPLRPFVWHAF